MIRVPVSSPLYRSGLTPEVSVFSHVSGFSKPTPWIICCREGVLCSNLDPEAWANHINSLILSFYLGKKGTKCPQLNPFPALNGLRNRAPSVQSLVHGRILVSRSPFCLERTGAHQSDSHERWHDGTHMPLIHSVFSPPSRL